MKSLTTLDELWREAGFAPNPNQERAIKHIDGPLFLTAGPGSGKTRVLLWRTVNLIVFYGVRPEEIFLGTFTEKAAFQLQQGLQSLLGRVTNKIGKPFDISQMFIGTVHSLCRKLIADRRFTPNRSRAEQPLLMDDLDQYFFFRTRRMLNLLMEAAGIQDPRQINEFFEAQTQSRHVAATNCINLFNRFSEENLDPDKMLQKTADPQLHALIEMYACYKAQLSIQNRVDFSILQQRAFESLDRVEGAGSIFKHVIIDEYQDTNTIQEQLYFKLASGHRNLCVVGDDDQALYRFRAARVENFVEFPDRCRRFFHRLPTEIPLNINYRSRRGIVDFYKDFIDQCDWSREDGRGEYRVSSKKIRAHSADSHPSVVATSHDKPEVCYGEIAALVRELLNTGKVQDPNQIAFLFPSMQFQGKMNSGVERMKAALESAGFRVYAPRAGRFLDGEEAVAVFGIFLHVFGKPDRGDFSGRNFDQFHDWIDTCYRRGTELLRHDKDLKRFVESLKQEIGKLTDDYRNLLTTAESRGWPVDAPYRPDAMRRSLLETPKLSSGAKQTIQSQYFDRIIKERMEQGDPFTLGYIINTATSLDWNVLDLFYRVAAFATFKPWFDLAEKGEDEGPICNLGLLSQYLSGFLEKYSSILTANKLDQGIFHRLFFSEYLYALHQRGESEYEDAEDPFPKGRIPFLTVHQSKGLEFPVVVLGSVSKRDKAQPLEETIRPLLDRPGEPLDRSPEFDNMRMFYVALSRAQNLLVIAHPRGQGISTHRAFKTLLGKDFPRLPKFDLASVPEFREETREIPRIYSYTGDYLLFRKCPRQYMIFRKYGFVPSRSQMQFFGSLVHQTIEDLHQYLIASRDRAARAQTKGAGQ